MPDINDKKCETCGNTYSGETCPACAGAAPKKKFKLKRSTVLYLGYGGAILFLILIMWLRR